MKLRSLLAITALALLSACQKNTTQPDTLSQFTNYSFENKTGKSVIVRIEDIATHEAFYMNVAAGVRGTVPNNILADGKRIRPLSYYWATTDFEMSSWYMADTKELHDSANITYSDQRYIYNVPIAPVVKSKRMKYFLTGIDGPTTWVAVDAYNDSGKSIWATLSNAAKNHQVTVNYDKTAMHDHANSKGATIRDYFYYDFPYYNQLTEEADIYLRSNNYSSADTAIPASYNISMRNVVYSKVQLHTTSTDTAFMTINLTAPYYKMAKVSRS